MEMEAPFDGLLTPSPSPVPPTRDKVGSSGEMKGIILKRLLLQWGRGLRLGDEVEIFFTFCSSDLGVGVYLLLGHLYVSQLFPSINYV